MRGIVKTAEKKVTSKGLWWESLQIQLFGEILWLHGKWLKCQLQYQCHKVLLWSH